jgi:hypothetical protein
VPLGEALGLADAVPLGVAVSVSVAVIVKLGLGVSWVLQTSACKL